MSYITVTPSDAKWAEVEARYRTLGQGVPYSDANALAVMDDAPGGVACLAMTIDGGDGFIWIGGLIGPAVTWPLLAKAGALALALRTPTTRHYRTTMPRALPASARRNAAERLLGGNGQKQLKMTWLNVWNEDGRWLIEGVLSDAVSRLSSVVLP